MYVWITEQAKKLRANMEKKGVAPGVVEQILQSVTSFGTLFRHVLIALGQQPPAHRREATVKLAEEVGFDPKPFLGDPAYDLTQHLLNPPAVSTLANGQTIDRMEDLAGVEAARVRQWLFARAAAEPRETWAEGSLTAIARAMRV